jgi:hypothetical protein
MRRMRASHLPNAFVATRGDVSVVAAIVYCAGLLLELAANTDADVAVPVARHDGDHALAVAVVIRLHDVWHAAVRGRCEREQLHSHRADVLCVQRQCQRRAAMHVRWRVDCAW